MKKLPVSGPTVLPTLDDYHVWPVKHRHWSFELVEDEDREPFWFTTIRDPENPGPIRPDIEAIIAAHRDWMATEEI